jgi:hypothetical protein
MTTTPTMSPTLTYLHARCTELEIEMHYLATRHMVESAAIRRNKVSILREVIESITLMELGLKEVAA